MPSGPSNHDLKNIESVINEYNIGSLNSIQKLNYPASRGLKLIIETDRGKFFLKQRPKGKDDIYRICYSHAIHNHLYKKNFPTAKLIKTADEKSTLVQQNSTIYEMYLYIDGSRYADTYKQTAQAGYYLATFHGALMDFRSDFKPVYRTFHDSSNVRHYLKTAHANYSKQKNSLCTDIIERLISLYNDASINVNQLGYDSWPANIIHGDWHPGNMLFDNGSLICVLDFDSVRSAPVVNDLANGILQFSIVAARPHPKDWPDYLDINKLASFYSGYAQLAQLTDYMKRAVIDLMIENIISEAIPPIAATGSFYETKGEDFLPMIHRKASWIYQNRDELTEKFA